jgi:polysaccharide biosynthesis protein PslH
MIDHANSSGVLPVLRQARTSARLCYVAHNAEGLVRPAVAAATQRPLHRAVMQLDAEKYRRIEIATVRAAHCVICISDADAQYFSQHHPNVHVVPPVFMGKRRDLDTVQEDRPRALLLVGSFDWIAKQRNLEMIVSAIGPVFRQHGIILNVVGKIAPRLKERLEKRNPWLHFHGQLAEYGDVATRCRGGLLAEAFGGGFKLKMLDYAFMRLPIFGLIQAAIGTTAEERSAMFTAEDHAELGKIIVENIDKLDELNQQQQRLYELASRRYSLQRMIRQVSEIFGQSV